MSALLARLQQAGFGGERVARLEHVGTFMQRGAEVFGYQYGHIRLKIMDSEWDLVGNVDLMWPKGDINGLMTALASQKRRSLWDYVKDDKERYYFHTRHTLNDPFQSLTNWSLLQNEMETIPDRVESAQLTLKLCKE